MIWLRWFFLCVSLLTGHNNNVVFPGQNEPDTNTDRPALAKMELFLTLKSPLSAPIITLL